MQARPTAQRACARCWRSEVIGEVGAEVAAAYSQDTVTVKPTVGKNFLQSTGLAAVCLAISTTGTFSVAATLVEARAIEEFSLRSASETFAVSVAATSVEATEIEELALRTALGSTFAVSVVATAATTEIEEFSFFASVLTGAVSAALGDGLASDDVPGRRALCSLSTVLACSRVW